MKTKALSFEEEQMPILNPIDSELKENDHNKLKDKEYLYGQSIAAEIRNFGELERCMIKHKINNIIFKYQMNNYASSSSPNNPLMRMWGLISGEFIWSSSVDSNEFALPSTNSHNLFSPQKNFTSSRAATSTYCDYQTGQ